MIKCKATRLTLAALLAGALAMPAFAEGTLTDGSAVYASSFKNLKDQSESLASLKGKVTVIYFWATWCVPCRVETPKLVKLYDGYKAKGVEVVGIALDNADKVRAFVKDMNATYPVYYGGHDAVELGKTLGNDQGAIPFMVVIDKAGKIVATFKGDLPDGKLESVIDPLIS
jgi:thiol-disulfide isomerase/thioredoxin